LGDYAGRSPRPTSAMNQSTNGSLQRLGEGSKFAVGLPPRAEEDPVFGREQLDVIDGAARFLIEVHHPSPAVCPPSLDVLSYPGSKKQNQSLYTCV
jgi:hypothetical protein